MDLRRRHRGGGGLLHREGIASFAVGERPQARLGAAFRRVLLGDELRELDVRGRHAVADGGEHRRAEASLVGVGKRRRELLRRLEERALRRLRFRQRPCLLRHLLEEDLRRHQLVGHAVAHQDRDLVERHRQRLEPRDVVFVVLGRLERQHRDQLRRIDVDAAELRDRHLPVLEARPFQTELQLPHHEALVERLLLGKTAGVDGLEPRHKLPIVLEIFRDVLLGEVAQPVVVALVAEDRGELRAVLEVVFPLLGEEVSELLAAGVEIVRRRGGQNQGEDEGHGRALRP